MNELSAVVERLRVVRAACRRFMQMHAMETAVIHPGLDRVAADLDLAMDSDADSADGPDDADDGGVPPLAGQNDGPPIMDA